MQIKKFEKFLNYDNSGILFFQMKKGLFDVGKPNPNIVIVFFIFLFFPFCPSTRSQHPHGLNKIIKIQGYSWIIHDIYSKFFEKKSCLNWLNLNDFWEKLFKFIEFDWIFWKKKLFKFTELYEGKSLFKFVKLT